MFERKFINGNAAVAHAVRMIQPEVIAAYPITPQSTIVEKVAEFIAQGELDAEYIKVESEHSALAACFGAVSAGCRVFTATSSQGLAYMCEMLPYVSGNRMPMVMAVANRGMAAPWTIWGDHQDSVSMRDQGWIQLYVENAQEAFDTCLQAYLLSEDSAVRTPVMVCLDGFVVSHTDELVELPDLQAVQQFLPTYQPLYSIDPATPFTFSIGVAPDRYMEYKYSQQLGMDAALHLIPQISARFAAIFGREQAGLIDAYRCADAEYVLVTMGSVTGTARVVADKLRSSGLKTGVLKVRSFRPFPSKALVEVLSQVKGIGILDRNYSFGNQGALGTEVKAALAGNTAQQQIINFIAGLGGRDIKPSDLELMYQKIVQAVELDTVAQPVEFIGLRG
ncbi:MAG: pyruvate ferredoxin oxidoreductase [Peptococcaceae bacterium]|nr:pyruvate ferredoxin oxidoreductase [Peptococcaceae bacterium]